LKPAPIAWSHTKGLSAGPGAPGFREAQDFNFDLDADFAGYTDLFAGLGALGLAGHPPSQDLRSQAICTNGRQKLCKPAKRYLG